MSRPRSNACTGRGVFLALGVDELLLDLPLELMHDGEDFLALKHPLGRFVNSSSPVASQALEMTPVRTHRLSWMSWRRARSRPA